MCSSPPNAVDVQNDSHDSVPSIQTLGKWFCQCVLIYFRVLMPVWKRKLPKHDLKPALRAKGDEHDA